MKEKTSIEITERIKTFEDALAKDKLLADREIPEVAELFGDVGIAVIQEESFFIELKKENE